MLKKKSVTQYTAEKIRPDCIVLRNRGAIVAHIQHTPAGHVAPGWKVIPNQAGRRPSRRPYPTATDAAEKFFDKSAAQAVAAVEHDSDNGQADQGAQS
jgi:hypothetical protein